MITQLFSAVFRVFADKGLGGSATLEATRNANSKHDEKFVRRIAEELLERSPRSC